MYFKLKIDPTHSTLNCDPANNLSNWQNIPEELINNSQWVCFMFVDKGKEKPDKVPYDPSNGWNASTDDPKTWSTFEKAVTSFENKGFDGIGYVFSEDDDYCGIDLDNCIKNGQILPFAHEIINNINSYTEVSPSGTGVHIIIKGKKNGERCRKKGVEIYDKNQFFTMTGNHIAGTVFTIEPRQEGGTL